MTTRRRSARGFAGLALTSVVLVVGSSGILRAQRDPAEPAQGKPAPKFVARPAGINWPGRPRTSRWPTSSPTSRTAISRARPSAMEVRLLLGLARQMCDAKRSLPAFDTRPRGIDDITHGLLLSELHNRISCKVEKLFMLNSLRRSFEVKGQNLQLPFYRH